MESLDVYKVVCPSGKVVLLREMKVKYEDLAFRAVGNKAGKNEHLTGKMLQDELLKILIVEVDGQKPDSTKMESLDAMFSYLDIRFLRTVMNKITGGEDEGEKKPLVLEVVSGSGKP